MNYKLESKLDDILIHIQPQKNFHPSPTASERTAWESLPGSTLEKLITRGKAALGQAVPQLTASLFMEFALDGNRVNYERPYFLRRQLLADLVLAECAEGSGQFMDDIINFLWAILEETSWVLPAHNNMPNNIGQSLPDIENPIIDLFATETGAVLSYTLYLLRDQLDEVTPLISRRIEMELQTRIIDPFLKRNDFWWMGLNGQPLNNWTPWCVSNCLPPLLLIERSEKHRWLGIKRAIQFLDLYLEQMPNDGGCDEGSSYWVQAAASLMDCLEMLLHATNGTVNFFDIDKVKALGNFIADMHIIGDRYVNFADCSARVAVPPSVLYRYGKLIGSDKLKSLGSYLKKQPINQIKLGDVREQTLMRKLWAVFVDDELTNLDVSYSSILQYWYPDTQVMVARSDESTARGWFLAAKGGHNGESHNHNDVGSYIVALDGDIILCDIGVESYTKKTFSDKRYEIWTMQSAFHNLPTINGIQQSPGKEFAASNVECVLKDDSATLTMGLASCYHSDAHLHDWQRTIMLNRGEGDSISIWDSFDLGRVIGDIVFSFMTPYEPELTYHSAKIHNAVLAWDAILDATVEEYPINDTRLATNWGKSLYRLTLRTPKQVMRGAYSFNLTRYRRG